MPPTPLYPSLQELQSTANPYNRDVTRAGNKRALPLNSPSMQPSDIKPRTSVPPFALVCHRRADLGVALWGRDFKPDVHAEIVRKAVDEDYYPSVDIYLPVCKEPTFLLSNTWKYIHALDYPNFSVFVLDDGASDEVRDLTAKFGFNCELA